MRTCPVSVLVAVTVAFGTARPCGSVTVPEIAPVPADCACAIVAQKIIKPNVANSAITIVRAVNRVFIPSPKIQIRLLTVLTDWCGRMQA